MSNKPSYNVNPPGVPKQSLKGTHALDANRYAIDRFIMDETYPEMAATVDNLDFLRKSREHAKAVIKQNLDTIEKLDKLEIQIEQSPYKPGDVAFHKELGNVIIEGYALNADDNQIVLRVTNAKQRIVVSATELAPISSTTKLLYGK